jgi:hypothetical protein
LRKIIIFLLTALLLAGCTPNAKNSPAIEGQSDNAGSAPDSTLGTPGSGNDAVSDIDGGLNDQVTDESVQENGTTQENGPAQENGSVQKAEETAAGGTGAENTMPVNNWDVSVNKEAITDKWYTGAVGSAGIHARFDISDYKVTGTYYYDRYKTQIPLEGYLEDDIKGMLWMRLTEKTDKSGSVYILFRTDDYVQGFWKSGETVYPMYLIREGSGAEPPEPAGDEALAYKGLWYGRRSYYSGSEVTFTPLFSDLLFYDMSAYNGANSGWLESFGILENGSFRTVFGESVYDSDENVEFSFTLNDNTIALDSNMYDYMCGMGVTFSDMFTRERPEVAVPTAREAGIVDSDEMEKVFRELTGDDFENFISYTHFVQYEDITLDGKPASAGSSYLRGMPGMCFYIVADNKIYAAYSDYERIHYYTNDMKYAEKMPVPMQEWASGYGMEILYNYKDVK